MFNFPGASSHQMLHYLDLHLEDREINTVVIHVGINDILKDSNQSSIDGLLQNIKNMSLKCKKFSVKKHWYFGKNVMIQTCCQKYGWFYVETYEETETCEESIYTKMTFI